MVVRPRALYAPPSAVGPPALVYEPFVSRFQEHGSGFVPPRRCRGLRPNDRRCAFRQEDTGAPMRAGEARLG